MVVARLLEILFAVLVVTEVVIPLFRGTLLFPMFRRPNQAKLLHSLEEAKQDLAEDDIEDQVAKLREEHAKRHPKVEPPPTPEPAKKANDTY